MNLVYEDVVCMVYANLNTSIKDVVHNSICQKLVVIEQEDIIRFLNMSVGEDKNTEVSKEVAYEAILGYCVEPKNSYLKKEMPLQFQLLHRIIVQCVIN